MELLPDGVYSAAQVRAMDRHAIDSGTPGYELMQRAGAAALACLQRHWPGASDVVILCGASNNAGDGYVLARLARDAGLEVRAFALSDPARLHEDAARAHTDFVAAGGRPARFDRAALSGCAVVVDALLGTGVDRPVAGAIAECIAAVNAAGRPVLALDLPSGLDADSGRVLGVAVHATRTISFVALKSGLYLGAAPDHVGDLEFAGLGIPDAARAAHAPVLRRIPGHLVAAALPRLGRSAHKGDRGRVLIVGGLAMAGAARLAGEAALRTGAGLVTIATGKESVATIVAGRPELIGRALGTVRELAPLIA
ncbi:MAG: NAD(P)H-hydrate epimerase, partial [Steroidobacteraceae bacterium]